MHRVLPIVIIWIIVDFYFFQAVKTVTNNKLIYWAYWLFDGILASIILFAIFNNKIISQPPKGAFWLMGLMIVSLAPKLVVTPILLLEDIGRLLYFGISWLKKLFPEYANDIIAFPARRKFLSQLALGISAIPLISLVYGMIKGKYDYQVRKITLKYKDLPDAFHGFTITQLSDIHSGSFDSKEDVERGIALVNQQNSKLLLFTGDLVNNRADEMDDWKASFSALSAPYGKYSVLGNHDYGDYIPWESEQAKQNNLQQLKEVHKEIGFNLLLNQNVKIEKEGQHISLIGVENWGKGGFHKYGDLNKAAADVADDSFKILMSHDPSHWEAVTLHHPKHIHLTLAGHTHGMQFGIEIPGIKWSPIKYIYPQWAGAYKKKDKYIYVNRGFGFLGYPGRVGILPEITVITLEKA